MYYNSSIKRVKSTYDCNWGLGTLEKNTIILFRFCFVFEICALDIFSPMLKFNFRYKKAMRFKSFIVEFCAVARITNYDVILEVNVISIRVLCFFSYTKFQFIVVCICWFACFFWISLRRLCVVLMPLFRCPHGFNCIACIHATVMMAV